MKKQPNYITKAWQAWFYILLGIFGGGYQLAWFMESGNPWGMIGFLGLTAMATRVAIKRMKWKNANR